MKLLYAYKALDYINAGLTLPRSITSTYERVGSSPFIQYQTSASNFYRSGDYLAVVTSSGYLGVMLFDALLAAKVGEVITVGYRLMRTVTLPSSRSVMMAINGVTLMTWADLSDTPVNGTEVFVEVVLDPTLNRATSYVDGRKVSEAILPNKNSLGDAFLYLSMPSSVSVIAYMDDMYAAIFDAEDGIKRLNAWSCSTLTQLAGGESAAGVVYDKPKVIEYSAPVEGTLMVGADIQAENPQLYSALNVAITDGVTEGTATLNKILQRYATAMSGVTTNSGRPTATLRPAAGASKVSLTLKATVK